jgi:hypothetical protein
MVPAMLSGGIEVGGDDMPRRPQRLKKEVPMHVQEVLKEISTLENPVDSPMRLSDFKGISDKDRAPSKTINNELYVKGLPFELDNDGVRKLFVREGHKPKAVRVLKDRKDKTRSLGFGFVRFKNEQEADAAMRALNGKTLGSGEKGDEKVVLSVSRASAKGKDRQMSSRTKKKDFQHQVDIRKMQLQFGSNTKPVTSLDQMPRSYRVLADKNAKTKREMTEELAAGAADDEGSQVDDSRAQKLLDEYLKEGGAIEDISAEEFKAEVSAGMKSGARGDGILYGGETLDDEDDEDWLFKEGDDDDDDEWFGEVEAGVDPKVARIEEEEEERRNWEEYQVLATVLPPARSFCGLVSLTL